MKVVKFGGSSLASAGQLEKVVHIIKGDVQRKFVVVSAPGKRTQDDIKVTDLLIAYYEATLTHLPTTEFTQEIIQRYQEIADAFQVEKAIMAEIKENILSLQTLPITNNPHLSDTFLASGENNNAKLIAGILRTQGVAARYINPKELGMIVSDEPGNARILQKSYEQIYAWRNESEILVIPGFFGYTEAGQICTFSRGGSDITGSIVAAGMKVDLYENFTDVDGIYVSHPGFVHEPETIKELTYREMRELAYAGFSVFHDEALMPSYRAKIPVVIKNTNNPQHPGTLITTKRDISQQPVVGIASDQGFASIYISKYLMNREIGFVRRILQVFEDLSLSYEHMPSGIDDVSIILRERQLTKESEEELMRRLAFELDPDELRITHGLSMIMVVGEGMRQRVGITAESTSALARKHVNLEMINQGSSEVSIMFGIQEVQEEKAIRALYYTFFD
ncbi:aspartate kinase [Enterococcus phoeniculicola]|jgi:aspartate kinase|uniref:Aspartokinase n=1 Tax=Enterococcus phoeniculicola ATCC BAA-412 TaxID=1158610 RepID=R3WMQ3_9ENTE|nr:aspartate kinase [Enterococcus phoeniculicola]EOL48747.1 aspartate kinase [Enterococcus phoeniculicola ATCC BAA-412]EOT72593.1 aspartate kinase [Enterococcus phoeniculicola ATCC BAA-412]OJG71866.1 aspartate kinase [Enterococcus phoeniculicola]